MNFHKLFKISLARPHSALRHSESPVTTVRLLPLIQSTIAPNETAPALTFFSRRTLNKIILSLLCLTLLAACVPTDQEEMLNGTWVGQQKEVDDDGDEIEYNVTLNFDSENYEAEVIVDIAYQDMGKIATMKIYGSWDADENEISIYPDEDKFKVSFSDNVRALSSMLGVSASDIEDMIKLMLSASMDSIESMKIYSLTDSKLKVDFDGPLTLYKQ